MAVTSNRRVITRFWTDDGVLTSQFVNEQDNDDSASQTEIVELASGNNAITVPENAVAVTIIPPATNTGDDEVTIILKGINGDTGIALHPTAPTSIGLKDTVSTFVLNASALLAGVRFIWS